MWEKVGLRGLVQDTGLFVQLGAIAMSKVLTAEKSIACSKAGPRARKSGRSDH